MMAVRTMRGALVALVVGIIIGIGATIWLARKGERGESTIPARLTSAAQDAILNRCRSSTTRLQLKRLQHSSRLLPPLAACD